ncbi:MAG TPA: translation factor GTPase family protein [Nocardioides sp.]
MTSLNLGILAHVDAGKTSLTERLLYDAGAIDRPGSVDAGTTHTDTLALERARGITIRSAVVAFTIGDVAVNLIDTPGHSDFIAEVERVLGVLDGAVLVVSAVEGVQAQTRVLMRALQRLGVPTLVFVNKVDRLGARPDGVLKEITDLLLPGAVAMGEAAGAGTRDAKVRRYDAAGPRLLDTLTRYDDRLLADWVEHPARVTPSRLATTLQDQVRAGLVQPVFFGSAISGAGVGDLADGIAELLRPAPADIAGPTSGVVFKVERQPEGTKVAHVRMFGGTLRVRDRVALAGREPARLTALQVYADGRVTSRAEVVAGEIAQVWGLTEARVGDVVGVPKPGAQHRFAPPALETVVDPVDAADTAARARLHSALARLAEQDPLIGLRQDDVRRELSVSLYGEVQKEVIAATLASEYGVRATFRETTTVCVERVIGTGAAYQVIAVDPNPFLATVGLRVEPGPPGSGVTFRLGVELGSMPPAFFVAVEQAVRETLREGLHGWVVDGCVVTMTHSGYWARQSHSHGSFDASMSSTAGDFRTLTPLVLMAALREAGTRVLEPVSRVEIELPDDCLGAVLAALTRLGGVPVDTGRRGPSTLLTGHLPAGRVHSLQQQLPTLTHGTGVLVTEFAHYAPVRGPVPDRARTDHNPLDRQEYLRRVGR